MKKKVIFCSLLFVTFVFVGFLKSDEDVEIHGFGSWSYGITDGNPYLSGNEKGNYSNGDFFLNVNARITEKLTVISQIGAKQVDSGIEFLYDYAFAEWAFGDSFKVRIGKVKHPFGIYGEINKVGILRPLYSLPQGMYGPQGNVGDGLSGIAVAGAADIFNGFHLNYDFYAGQIRSMNGIPNIMGFSITLDPRYYNSDIRYFFKIIDDIYGGKLTLELPIKGLSVGISIYRGSTRKVEPENDPGFSGPQASYNYFMEYMTSKILFRAEYNMLKSNFDMTVNSVIPWMHISGESYYVEAGYKLTNRLQAVFRYDYFDETMDEIPREQTPLFWQAYFTHKDIAFGINYWFNPNLVIRLSYHQVNGLRMSWPTFKDVENILAGDFDQKTRSIQLGTHFCF